MISHTHKFIFFWIPKTAGTSVEFALKPYGLQKYGRPGHRPHKKNKDRWLISSPRVKDSLLSPEYTANWNSYFKFSFIRNHWDYLVSWYEYHRKKWESNGINSFEDFVLNKGFLLHESDPFLGFFHYLCDDTGSIAVDFIGRVENIQQDFNTICNRINVTTQLEQKNKTKNKKHYSLYYNKETRNFVYEYFAEEIDYFGYKFEEKS